MAQKRKCVNADPEFLNKLHKIQEEKMKKNGVKTSITEITSDIAKNSTFEEEVVRQIINKSKNKDLMLKIKYDKGRR